MGTPDVIPNDLNPSAEKISGKLGSSKFVRLNSFEFQTALQTFANNSDQFKDDKKKPTKFSRVTPSKNIP